MQYDPMTGQFTPGPPGAPGARPTGVNPYAAALRSPYAGGPQSGLGLPPGAGVPPAPGMGPAVPQVAPGGMPQQLTPQAAAMVGQFPGAQERFAQGERAGSLADELRRGSLEPARGRMVGRVYVPASITQHGAKLMQAWVARQKEQQQKEERRLASEEMSMLRRGYLESLSPGTGGAGTMDEEI